MGETEIDDLLGAMTLGERCSLLAGRTAWIVPGVERLGVPEWAVSDGPIGVRGRRVAPALCLPSASAWAATFDVDLVAELGRAVAAEARDRRITMVLGPTVNLHRHPLGGRHFECYSEDPHLSASVAVAYIEGVQDPTVDERVGACIKHFVANEQEHERRTISSDVDERTLRELYLLPFEAAVRAGVWGVMAAYNDVNGEPACDHVGLLRDVLKDEWGFPGLVVSDWGAMTSTAGPALGGLDLEMPGPGRFWGHGGLEAAVVRGDVAEDLVADKARRVLRFLDWAGLLGSDGRGHEESSVDRPEHRELARAAAADGMVLLRNEQSLLPLDPATLGRVAVIGPNAEHTSLFGGGSAALAPHRTTNVLDALAARLGDAVEVRHVPGCSIRLGPRDLLPHHLPGGVTVELFDREHPTGEPFAVEEGRGARNIWMDHSWPDGIDTLSVRATATLVPDASGRWRLGAGAFGLVQVFLDGELVADSAVEHFSSAVAMRYAATWVELEAGREYELVVETRPHAPGWRFLITRFGGNHDPERPDELDEAASAAAASDVAVVVVGTSLEYESEDDDRRTLALPGEQDELVRRVAAANPRTVVVVNTGSPVTMPWADEVPAIVQAWFPGQEGGHAVADVLLGDAEPGGRLPTTWPRRIEDTPAHLDWPGEAGHVRYGEGVHVGYRWYDARRLDPQWCFGHGLSYGRTTWGEPEVSCRSFAAGDRSVTIHLTVPVTGTGDRAGAEVVQAYVAPVAPPVRRPPQELRAFAKVRPAPGETVAAALVLDWRSFARWDPASHGWVVDPGAYDVHLARSSRDVVATVRVDVS